MPSAIAHYLLAQELMAHYAPTEMPIRHPAPFFCGAQGPDFLLIHRGFPWQRGQSLLETGRMIHRQSPAAFFEALRTWLCAHPDRDAARDYALGFLTHYALDQTAHPYVYSQVEVWTESNPAMSKREAHVRIETALDVILLRYLRGQTPLEFPLKQVYPGLGTGEPEIVAMTARAIHAVFGQAVAPRLLIQAMHDFRLCQRLLHDPTLLKKPFMERLERRLIRKEIAPSAYIRPLSEGVDDFANVQHDSWANPNEDNPQTHTEDFFALYHRAFALSQRLIDGFRESLQNPTVDLYTLTGNISYLTGLPVPEEN